jgi:hypothetical protein
MKQIIFFILFFISFNSQSALKTANYDLQGVTPDHDKCTVLINLEEKYISFETKKQMCDFTIDEDEVEELKSPLSRQVTAKGYSNWFDCKVKISFDAKGHPYQAKIHSRLSLAMTFKTEMCFFN